MKKRSERLLFALFAVSLYFTILVEWQNANNVAQNSISIEVVVNINPRNSTFIKKIYPKHTELQKFKNDMKYILIWHSYDNFYPFYRIKTKEDAFIENKCKYVNCYITKNRNHLNNLTDFDAILFSGASIKNVVSRTELPLTRSQKQKYIYGNIGPAVYYPITNPIFDDFFNWTWTYRFDSDISWKYITIYDLGGKVIGPSVNMKWPQKLEPISNDLKTKLKRKTKSVAWFVSRCVTNSRREEFVEFLKNESKPYGWSVDVFGRCGNMQCGEQNSEKCFKMLENDYHFYLSFESSFDEDHVSEKLLTALNNHAVPIVYGGANYSRFLPPGSYLNARELGVKKLVKVMNDILQNSNLYYDFFRWRNHFRYDSSEVTTEMCNLCAAMNDKKLMKRSSHRKFLYWWNGPARQQTYDFLLNNFLSNTKLLDLASTYNFTREGSLDLFKNIQHQKLNFSSYITQPLATADGDTAETIAIIDNMTLNLSLPIYDFNFTTSDSTETYNIILNSDTPTDGD